MKLELYSEPVGPSGGAPGSIMEQAISSTHYDLVQTVLREALQNSCDYRQTLDSRISFSMSVFKFSNEQQEFLKDGLSPSVTADRELKTEVVFDSDEVSGLLITDSGTIGLAGPIDPSLDHTPDNFTGFFFRMGREYVGERGGGSAGVGRAAFFSFSECSTSLIYSRYKEAGVVKSRFMGMALGPTFKQGDKKFTGRHWYCHSVKDSLPIPIEGKAADEIADLLGMRADFHHETGTSILIIQPKLNYIEDADDNYLFRDGDLLRSELAKKFVDTTVLFAWPHIYDGTVDFYFNANGTPIEMPALSAVPCIRDFVEAYSKLTDTESKNDTNVRSILFNEHDDDVLGRLAWLETLTSSEAEIYQSYAGISAGAVALMRQAKFVVMYKPVVTRIDSTVIRGVFLVSEKHESSFRKSEPAAHDEWLPERLGLPPKRNNPISQALRKIEKVFKELNVPRATSIPGSSLVALANSIGQFFSENGVQGVPIIPTSGPGGGGRAAAGKKAILSEIGSPRIVRSNISHVNSEFNFKLEIDKSDQRTYRADFKLAATLSDQPIETSQPVNSDSPTLEEVRLNGKVIEVRDILLSNADTEAHLLIAVKSPTNVAVGVIATMLVVEDKTS